MADIKYGSVTKTHKLDDDGSVLKTTISKKVELQPNIRLDYTIRHRITSKEDEATVLSLNQTRQEARNLFDVSLVYEGKSKLSPKDYYYMVEHFTIYRRWQDEPHLRDFVEQERKEFVL